MVLVEFHSGGQVAERVSECEHLGLFTVVADNAGTYRGGGPVVRTDGNVGFGAACNRAVAALPDTVEVVVLMNPDARIHRDALLRLVAHVRSGEWDLVAPQTRTPSGVRNGFTRPGSWRELALTVREWVRLRKPRDHADSTPSAPSPPGSIRGVLPCPRRRFGSAALLAVRRSAFDSVGGFDESYFLYVEDADLWDRLVVSGARAGFAEGAELVHDAATGSRASASRRIALRRLGIEHYLSRRRRTWRPARILHRALLPQVDQDRVMAAIEHGYRRGSSAEHILDAVRHVALGEGE